MSEPHGCAVSQALGGVSGEMAEFSIGGEGSEVFMMADEPCEDEEKLSKTKSHKVKKKKHETKSSDEGSSKIKKSKKSKEGFQYTVSLALPGSILSNAQSLELRTYLAGQIARALVVFNVDEVIVFNESLKNTTNIDSTFRGAGKKSDPNILLGRILQYLECPQYLRKSFFPKHPDLQYAGLLNPLDCPHHMRIDDKLPYREGVVVDRPIKDGKGSLVNVGLRHEIYIDKHLKSGTRVTVKLNYKDKGGKIIANCGSSIAAVRKIFSYGYKSNCFESGANYIITLPSSSGDYVDDGVVVPPNEPRTEKGIYWGYSVRLAHTFGEVFTQCPYKGGYDVTVGTSERGTSVDTLELPTFRHMLIVFGGLHGLEASLESDESLNAVDPSSLFHYYINTCPDQGSRTIRTEEAILITMASMRTVIAQANT